MAGLVNKVIQKEKVDREELFGVGIDLPGYIDTLGGICYFSPNFPEWKNVEVGSYLEKKLGLPVMILNDVNAAALGEKFFGAGKYVDNMYV